MKKNPIVMATTSLHHRANNKTIGEVHELLEKSKYGVGEKVLIEYEAQGEIWEVSGYITKRGMSAEDDEVIYEINDQITRRESEIVSRVTYDKREL